MARLFDDGSSEYLTATAPTIDVPLTMACWFNTNDLSSNQTPFSLGINDASNWGMFRLALLGTSNVLRAQQQESGASGNTGNSDSTATFGSNAWHHGAGVFVSNSSRFSYLDGTESTEATDALNSTTVDFLSAGVLQRQSFTQYMSGSVAECGLWDVALTAAEISSLAAGYSPLFVRPQSLIFYAPLVRDEDQDRIGALSLSAINTPSVSAHPRIIYPLFHQVLEFPTAAGVNTTIEVPQGGTAY